MTFIFKMRKKGIEMTNVYAKRLLLHFVSTVLFIQFCINFDMVLSQQTTQWTWMFKTFFTQEQREMNNKKQKISFVTTDTPHFTQCIFSWNAHRPHKKGYFSFYAQVRDTKSKKWNILHKMFDWGVDFQRSHFTISKVGTSYHYVRLEVPKELTVDGIRILIEPHDGAQLSSVCGLYVSASRLDHFVTEKPSQFFSLPSVCIKGIPSFSQKILNHPRKNELCSPTSLCMVTSYLTHKKLDPHIFATGVYDAGLDTFGSWPFNTAHAFEQTGGKYCFYVRRLPSFATLYKFLKHQIPIVVSVRGILTGAAKDYHKGHLLVVTGFLNKGTKLFILCHDPAFAQNEAVAVAYPLKDFLRTWECSRRLAYVIEPVSSL